MRHSIGVLALVIAAALPVPAVAATTDWPQYLHGPQHASVSTATAITTANAASLHQLWHFTPAAVSGKPAPKLEASPTVVGTRLYIGSEAGLFYALNTATGAVAWKRQLDVQAASTCAADGISATAAVVPDPTTGTLTVYAAGARDLYALNASTGAVIWKTMIGPPDPPMVDGSYNWASPTVVAGHIYLGLASRCDSPLIQGGVVELDQHTGALLHTWHSVPNGSIGGSVWSSVAATSNGQNVWASTGNECDPTIDTCPAGNRNGDSNSIVHLSGSLARLESWQAAGTFGGGQDSDFGSSPTLFGAGSPPPDVGACNKNGNYYALAANPLSAPIWTDQLGAAAGALSMCIASSVWNGQAGALYAAANATTIGGTHFGGSVRQVNPTTGAYLWQRGLPCAVLGTPSLDGAGVLAVGTYTGCVPSTAKTGAYLLNAATGAILATLPVANAKVFGQPVFAGTALYVATESGGLYAFGA
ncbi:MAG TPA: PQQ-binding-like beta-propeller repeat protein [Gaiellales bacterium]|nr:PQQ-binding-like beta-propeller repeat protein [Gaiellales bacterium]